MFFSETSWTRRERWGWQFRARGRYCPSCLEIVILLVLCSLSQLMSFFFALEAYRIIESRWFQVTVFIEFVANTKKILGTVYLILACTNTSVCPQHKFFFRFLGRAFKMEKNGVYFILIAFFVAKLFKIFDLCKLDDLWHHKIDTQIDVKSQNGISLQRCYG